MSDTESLKNLLDNCLRETTNGYTIHALFQELMNATDLISII